MTPLPKQYDTQEAEKRWQDYWLANGTYHWKNDLPREQTFVIDTPPPTVSGLLHMGHIFSYTQADFVARYQRMAGKDVFYPMGFDDNGLPTERLVEKTKNVRGSALAAQPNGRADFVALCREVVQEAENEFRALFKQTALSIDWRQEYQTISDDVRALSQASFLDLIAKGKAYRDFRPTYWDWVDGTAIASAEIENKEMPGAMHEIVFGVESEMWNVEKDPATSHLPPTTSSITIATTRPELLGACVAVMYHPEDPNAARYKDATAITPLFGVRVPMIADELVEREKGTGLVMCCTFGDDTDKEWWRKHSLPLRPVLSAQGKLDFENELYTASFPSPSSFLSPSSSGLTRGSPSVPGEEKDPRVKPEEDATGVLQSLKIKPAREKTVELLEAAGALLKKDPITHTVKCAERSGTPIEIIPTHQWFVRIMDEKQALLAKGAECHWHPEFMRIRLNQWIEGLKEDWCISRQRFFGVPFPVWYSKRAGEEGKPIYAEPSQLPVDPLVDLPKGYTRDEVEADKDVMDTWATSSISPQINAALGSSGEGRGAGEKLILAPLPSTLNPKLFPADLRPQAHEIIRTWAFYTIVKAHLHSNSIPWKNLMISGWCLAADKSKMSKSKGNVVTPLALLQDKGTDAVRYWASTSRLGADTAFSEDVLKIGRKLTTKIWNASQFVQRVCEDSGFRIQDMADASLNPESRILNPTETLDRWILTRLHRAVARATLEFERFEYADARAAIEDFFWNDFCDNYLEMVKGRAYGPLAERVEGRGLSEEEQLAPRPSPLAPQKSALHTLAHCLETILKLFAPFVPHVTEEIYSHLFTGKFSAAGSLHARGQWPKAEDFPLDEAAEKSGMAGVQLLSILRKAKSEAGVSIKTPVTQAQLFAAKDMPFTLLAGVLEDVKSAGNAASVTETATLPPGAITSDDGSYAASVTLAPAAEVA